MRRPRIAVALVGAGLLLVLGAGIAMAAGVSMVDDDFSPASVSVAAGESITFTNNGDRPHTATADNGSFDTGTVEPGATKTVSIDAPGTYRYFCQFHGGPGGDGMSGVITVAAAAGGGGGGGGTGGAGGAGDAGGDAGGAGAGGGPALPQTASPLPFIGLAGVGTLLTGLWVGRRRR